MMFSVDEEHLFQASNSSLRLEVCCVYCNGELNQEKLTSNYVTALNEDPYSRSCDATVQLFGHWFIVSSLPFKVKDLFFLLKQQLDQLQDTCLDVETTQCVVEESTRFLHWLHYYFHRCMQGRSQVAAHSVVVEIGDELDWVSNMLSLDYDHAMLQLSLHVMWTSVILNYHLIPLIGVSGFVSKCLGVANKLLSSASTRFNQQSTEAAFNDCSINKLWPTLYHLFSSLTTTHTLDTFWVHISNLLNQQVDKSSCFNWWFLTELSAVCAGPYWQVVHDHLLPSSLSTVDDETELRYVMKCVCALTHQWTPSLQVVTKVWELFYRNMNATSAVWISPTVLLSASQWAHYSVEWQCSYCSQPIRLVPSSFELFLRMVACTMACNDGHGWSQIKGRILSKVHSSWISKLELCGLKRVISLLLVLSQNAPDQQGNKTITILISCLDKPINTDSKNIIWKGIFAHLFVLQRCGLDLSLPIVHLVPHINCLVAHLLSNIITYETLWIVLSCIQELIELQSMCEQGATNLISTYLSELLSHHETLEGTQLSNILLFIENVASSLAGHVTKSSDSSCNVVTGSSNLLEYCTPVLISISKGQNQLSPSLQQQVIQSAASLYHLATCSNLQHRIKLLEGLSFSDDCNPRVACGFLCHILSEQCQDTIIIDEWRIAHCWFRCLLSCDCSQMTHLTNHLISLPSLSSYIQTKSSEPLLVLNQLLSAINTNYSRLRDDSSHDGSVWRKRLNVLVGDLMKYCGITTSNSATHKMKLQVTSLLVSVCPRLIYSKLENKCLLPQILDYLVLPLTTRNLHQLRPYLHMFLIGLFKLEPEKDGFIRRKIKQIFGKYFLGYAEQLIHPLTSHLANPFLLMLDQCKVAHPNSEVKQRLLFTIEHVSCEYLQVTSSEVNLLPVLHFLGCVTQIADHTLLYCCNKYLLSPLLTCLLNSCLHIASQVKDKVLCLLDQLLKESYPYECLWDAVRNYLTQHLVPLCFDIKIIMEPLLLSADLLPSSSGKEQLVTVCMNTAQELIVSKECIRKVEQCLAQIQYST